jgi:hypothetical protein
MSTNNKKNKNTPNNVKKNNGSPGVNNITQINATNSPGTDTPSFTNTPDTPISSEIADVSNTPTSLPKLNNPPSNTPLAVATTMADVPAINMTNFSTNASLNPSTRNNFTLNNSSSLNNEGGDYEESMGENYQNTVPLNSALVNQNKRNNQALAMAFNAQANNAAGYVEQITGNSTIMLILKIVLAFILLIIVINIIKYFYVKWAMDKTGSPMLINGTKNAKQAMVISQDPNHTNYIPIKRSVNQNGIEFSYAFWFVISDFTYKNGEWKHMFHKGNSSSYPNRAPGVWIHPTNNIIRIYMNTMQNILEYVDIDNIPIRKWVHMVITVQNRYLNIYVNGFLKIRKELTSLPRQNYGNVWTNLFGGYEGYLSKLQYFDRAITPFDIDGLVSNGPGNGACIDTNEIPPYLDDSWWLN